MKLAISGATGIIGTSLIRLASSQSCDNRFLITKMSKILVPLNFRVVLVKYVGLLWYLEDTVCYAEVFKK